MYDVFIIYKTYITRILGCGKVEENLSWWWVGSEPDLGIRVPLYQLSYRPSLSFKFPPLVFPFLDSKRVFGGVDLRLLLRALAFGDKFLSRYANDKVPIMIRPSSLCTR